VPQQGDAPRRRQHTGQCQNRCVRCKVDDLALGLAEDREASIYQEDRLWRLAISIWNSRSVWKQPMCPSDVWVSRTSGLVVMRRSYGWEHWPSGSAHGAAGGRSLTPCIDCATVTGLRRVSTGTAFQRGMLERSKSQELNWTACWSLDSTTTRQGKMAVVRIGIAGLGSVCHKGILPHLSQDDIKDRVEVAARWTLYRDERGP
jgi:hypothetical protein